MTKKTPRCDACNRRLRQNQHEAILSDATTGQVVGRYHAGLTRGKCMSAASKYIGPGVVIRATFLHPDRCGDDQEHCDAGLSERVA